MKKLFILVVSFLFLTGCVSAPSEDQVEAKAKRITVVSSGKPSDVLPAFTTFSWNAEYTKVLSATDSKTELEVKLYIKDQLIKYLKTKGYVYQADPVQADVVVGFLFALENDVADSKIQALFGLVPGVTTLGVNSNRYEKGTFLLTVLDNKVQHVYWRSAMQGFVDMEQSKEEQRLGQFQSVLATMMGQFPLAGE